MKNNKIQKYYLDGDKLIKKYENKILDFCKTFFTIFEWLIILTTIKFVEKSTNDIFFRFLFLIGDLILCLFVAVKWMNITSNFEFKLTEKLNFKNKNKKTWKRLAIPFITAIVFGTITGGVLNFLILIIVKKLLITF